MTMIETVERALLAPASLSPADLAKALGRVLTGSIDDGDIYLQSSCSESLLLEEGKLKDSHFSMEKGMGVRAVSGLKTGYAYADDISAAHLLRASNAAKSIAQHQANQTIAVSQSTGLASRYTQANPLAMGFDEKVALLKRIDAKIRQQESRVQRVNVSLSGEYQEVLLMAASGQLHADIRPLVRLHISVQAKEGSRVETATGGGGMRSDYHYFLDEGLINQYIDDVLREVRLNLEATAAPAGTMPVVLGPGWPGVLLHEAVGHGLEGDFNRKGTSAYSGRIGEQVAAKGVTVVDDGTLLNCRGSLNVDDEGTPTQRNVLIEDGILKGYLQDRLNARLMKTAPTGNGRRESYASMPMPRMTNTFMLGGNHDPQEIIESCQNGLYAADFSGGSVDITSGKFVFSASRAYLIENGKITRPVKGATLIGSGPEVMQQISMIGNDMALDKGTGTCGKDGQSVPVCVGQPTLKVDAMTVGGSQID